LRDGASVTTTNFTTPPSPPQALPVMADSRERLDQNVSAALAPSDGGAARHIAMGALGGLLFGAGSREGRSVLRLAGIALIGIAARPVAELVIRRAGERRRTVSLTRSIEIARSVEDVFAFVKDFENLPLVVRSLRSVVDYQDGRSRWEVYSPAGEILEWSAVVTKFVPNSIIAWESVPGGAVEATGVVRFIPLGPSRTRIEVEATYRPTHTPLREAIRALTTASLEDRVGKDMEHTRFYLESFRGGTSGR
jgi:uncharacterized membrane protein